MPVISSFRPYRYNPAHINDPGAVIAPPYDVISAEKRRALIQRDPHNVILLILPEGDDAEKYAHANELYRQWIDSGILEREPDEAIYPYAQLFDHPVTGDRIERRGFIAVARLSPFSAGEILPHEKTLSGPKADRLKLMLATDANLEPIFGVYPDPAGSSTERLNRLMENADPLLTVTDSDGVEHRLWRASAPGDIDGIAADLRGNRVFIVDGHHRYETALNYQRMMRERNPELPDGAPCDSIMIFLAPSSDPGLVILPTHRIIHSLPDFDFDALLARLEPNFALRDEAVDTAVTELSRHTSTPGFLLLAGNRAVLATLRPEIAAASLVDPSLPEPLQELDVTVLHDHILQNLLGITPEAQAAQSNLRYVKSMEDALEAAAGEDVQLVVVMNATRLEQVENVAGSGSVMPQKSTYFYPKLASGLLFNPLR
ncbi:MAG: hypothetical protein JWQ98_1005 [Chlorobi bacterium]|nr:hypothetical protein [Chlorobiota bacterium]